MNLEEKEFLRNDSVCGGYRDWETTEIGRAHV